MSYVQLVSSWLIFRYLDILVHWLWFTYLQRCQTRPRELIVHPPEPRRWSSKDRLSNWNTVLRAKYFDPHEPLIAVSVITVWVSRYTLRQGCETRISADLKISNFSFLFFFWTKIVLQNITYMIQLLSHLSSLSNSHLSKSKWS